MESAPPSYEKATLVNAWDLIADYLPSTDLCSAALVSSAWHTVFAPHLWGNPASHFGQENDRVYVALTRFKRTLPWARLSVRSLTHTLQLPPAHAEIYNGPHSDWLKEVLERLPNLQSLIVRGLPFFDHASLSYLKATSHESTSLPPFGLRLLDASRCGNVTSISLCQALKRFDSLLYLDLSWTHPAKDRGVLQTLRYLSGLQVLKLRGIGLKDEDVEVLAEALCLRVRSLDVRNNQLTDRSARTLLEHCFSSQTQGSDDYRFRSQGSDSPSLLHYLGTDMLDIYTGENFEAYLRSAFTFNFVSRLAIEDTPQGGITHLYISENQLTVEGVSGLLRSGRLHVLDIGMVKPSAYEHPSAWRSEDLEDVALPGAEKLVSVLAEGAGQRLTFLRIAHSLVTKEPVKSNAEVVPGRVELADTSSFADPAGLAELDDGNAIFELPANETPCFELSDTSTQHVASNPVDEQPRSTGMEEEPLEKARRGSAFAPEAVDSPQESLAGLLHPTATGTMVLDTATSAPGAGSATLGRPRTYSSVVTERHHRCAARAATGTGLNPGSLPKLKRLVLTDVPAKSPNPTTAERLISFVRDCAEELALAKLQARFDYTMPPNRKAFRETLKNTTRGIFALEEIVLEIARETPLRRKSVASAWRHAGTKSMTGDHDSEALWSAAHSDFSFFGEGEECGLPGESLGMPLGAMSGIEVATTTAVPGSAAISDARDVAAPAPQFDVIAKVAEFRRARKSVYQARLASGDEEPEVEGYWDGNVKVIRPPQGRDDPMREDDEAWVDYYGNVFSNAYLYR